MVQRCCVLYCETKVGDVDINGVKVRFHRMPMVPDRFQLWKVNITNHGQYKPEPDLTVNSRICSKHFLKEDYLDNCQKPVTGNHILSKDAVPTRFRWSSENCDVSAAIPFVRRVKPQQPTHYQPSSQYSFSKPYTHPRGGGGGDDTCIEHSAVEKQTQCSFEDERLKNEISRKNSIIQQLLERISQLEAEHKATTQLFLRESMSGSGATSVIRSTSPATSRDQELLSGSVSVTCNGNNNGSHASSPKRRKLQQPHEDDENIHFVLLSLSERVVRHDHNSVN